MAGDLFSRKFLWIFLSAALSGALVLAFPAATVLFVAGVLAHAVLGILLTLLLLRPLTRAWHEPRQPLGTLVFSAALATSAALGIFLLLGGNARAHAAERWLHVAASALALAALLAATRSWLPAARLGIASRRCVLAAISAALLIPALAITLRRLHPDPFYRITNPSQGFGSMQEETGGEGPFFPASSHTLSKHGPDALLAERFFEDSQSCQRCHNDIYQQWQSSAHHFASFNNQFYRASIEYMQDVQGSTRPSQWCAACHDSAVLFTGKWKTPIRAQIHTPAAQAGLGCLSCHAVVHVKDTIGNSAFTIEDPPLHDLVESRNRWLRMAHDSALYLQPSPHDMTFLKPFHTRQTSEFCSACHKVHLDVPVNHYRWSRGFDEYDNWQGSGVSGQGARSFYYPPKPQDCGGCHMPLVKSVDPAARGGFIHSHRFPAANTALPYVNGDSDQLRATEEFLKGSVSTDLFALVRGGSAERAGKRIAPHDNTPLAQSMFAQGEESGNAGLPAVTLRGQKLTTIAPLDQLQPALHPGESVRLDVVERTLRLGHFFPGGTVDAFDVWVELKASDGRGQPFFWSGKVLADGQIDPGAHFYRSLLLDAHGNPINKRNAWAARSTVYVHLIPPGAADTVHYRLSIPSGVVGPVTLEARLHYRKFSWYYTHFAYARNVHPGAATLDYDDRPLSFDGSTADVSGPVKRVPDLPIVTISSACVTLPVDTTGTRSPLAGAHAAAGERTRWNDYGIGLLLQGDLTGAESAFRHVTEIDSAYADGWLNVGRVLVQEGETEAARPFVEKALALDPSLPRAHYFRGLVEKSVGDYDRALAEFRLTADAYPRDRVVLNQLGRVLFLQRKYRAAIGYLLRSTDVDPENIEAHYDLMLAYRGIGDAAGAQREEQMYRRFKADESSQAIAGAYLRAHPEDNNERQPIHEHTGVTTAPTGRMQAANKPAPQPRHPAVEKRIGSTGCGIGGSPRIHPGALVPHSGTSVKAPIFFSGFSRGINAPHMNSRR